MRNTLIAVGLLGTLASSPVLAQTAAPSGTASTPPVPAGQQTVAPAASPAGPVHVTVGAAIVDSTGAPVGTVTQVSGPAVIVDTGTNKVGVPIGNFSQGATGLVLASTKASLDAAAAQSQAQLKALLVAGTDVHGTNGKVLGTVKAVGTDFATVTSSQGSDVRLPLTGFGATPAGLTFGTTQEEFDKAVAAAHK